MADTSRSKANVTSHSLFSRYNAIAGADSQFQTENHLNLLYLAVSTEQELNAMDMPINGNNNGKLSKDY
ncbi:MAG: hypothetical protein JAY94_14500 [Candidatus Thiodiazotropha endolucinida]|nr:hypothetical protein [Candidatus Thiodiazotropha taylori]MCW4318722.1 hypothetical protein [Candidatus Thiodiazotropha taylori]